MRFNVLRFWLAKLKVLVTQLPEQEIDMSKNRQAFLDTLAWAEGTDKPGQETNCRGYDVLVGGELFTDFSKHPEILVKLPRYGISSSAAGRYQFIRTTWHALRRRLKLPDFGPESQDKACLELLRECGALAYIDAGKFDLACHSARKIWASLPGAGYGQREQKIATLRKIYTEAGGTLG